MRKRWQSGIAKLLVAVMLLQGMPAAFGWGQAVYANDGGEGDSGTVTGSTYAPAAPIPVPPLQTRLTSATNDSLTDYKWEKVDVDGYNPEPRQYAAMIYDENAGNVVMFGGEDANGNLLDETWIWDGAETDWIEEAKSSDPKPSKRKSVVLAYDPANEKVLLFGGEGASKSLKNDTWLWDGHAGEWTEVNVAGAVPSPRAGAQMAYDGQNLVLFGGYTYASGKQQPLGDTWIWNGSEWTEAATSVSPPATYWGQMAFDGQTAVLYGGITGTSTNQYGDHTHETRTTSPELWSWDRSTGSWSSSAGPEGYGRWGHSMAYDGRRVVLFSGVMDYVHSNNNLVPNLKLPTSMYYLVGGSFAYGWKNGTWERTPLTVGTDGIYEKDTGYEGKVLTEDNQFLPFPLSHASMAFDGTQFILFGGGRGEIEVVDEPARIVDGEIVGGHGTGRSWPAGLVNETWVFGYTPPSPPGIKWTSEPVINFDPAHLNDTVSVVASVYSLGGRPVTSRGVEYRPTGTEAWIDVPYAANPEATGSFTTTLTGLVWQQGYEVRGYAVNELGTSYTEINRFEMIEDPYMDEPHVHFIRVGPSILHLKDKKRIVVVGDGITNLLRKPLDNIHFALEQGGNSYPLKYNILNGSQLELTWTADLQPGVYTVNLDHDFYREVEGYTYRFENAVEISELDFYKPRNFARVDVPSTSADNELDSLSLQGPFTEDPDLQNVYALNDPSEVVAIHETVLFKGSSLKVDKTNPAKTVVTGDGRLYVNAGDSQTGNVSYTLHDGPFTFTSDRFSLALNGGDKADYVRMEMPIRAGTLTFVKGGLSLTGDLELGMTVGDQKAAASLPVDGLQYRNSRFDLIGSYTMNKLLQVGPINVSDTQFDIDTRFPYVGVNGQGSLPGTSVSFDMRMKIKQGRLDGIDFSMFNKQKLAATGLQVNYLFGSADNLSGKTQIPQRFEATGSVADVIVPQLKHPSVDYKFNLLGTDSIDVRLTPSGFEAGGIAYYYWLPVNNMSLQAVTDPAKAGLKGFSNQGFLAQGDINAFDVIKGVIAAYSMKGKGYSGAIKATVYVPKGIPRLGGTTVRDVLLNVNEKQMIGTFKHNGVGARVSYTFGNNTILFEVEAEPPKKSWWEKGLDFINNVNDFFEKTEPLGDLLEEIFLFKPNTGLPDRIASNSGTGTESGPSPLLIAAAGDWAKTFDFAQFNGANSLAAASGALKKVYDLTPVGLAFQPDNHAKRDVNAKIADGQLTSLDRTPPVSAQTEATSGQTAYGFATERDFEALITLAGDHRSAVLSTSSSAKPNVWKAVSADSAYDAVSDTTFLRAKLSEGNWKIAVNGTSRIGVHELLFANPELAMGQLAEVWRDTPERPVTAWVAEERGLYAMTVRDAQGEVILYKPDGRPYKLHTSSSEPGWNAVLDAHDDYRILLNAVEAGTWLVSADGSPATEVNRVPAQTEMEQLAQWVQQDAYPTVFELSRIDNGQAIVEIYGANANTKLYKPDGSVYALQPDPDENGMNVFFDEAQQKMTVWLNESEWKGQWKAVSSGFTSVVAYKTSRKFKSIKPLLDEGRYSKHFDVAEKGDYLLSVNGGNAGTVILAPDGKPYALDFADPGGNAYLQPAADRMPETAPGGDPLEETQVQTPNPAHDGRDMLYVTLLNAPAGKWTVQNGKRADLQIQKLIPLPAVHAEAAPVAGADARVRVTWSTENAAAGTEVALMLTDSRDNYFGEVLADGLAASGSAEFEIPALTIPGTYHLAVAATSLEGAPAFAMAEGTVTVEAPYTLEAPAMPEVASTGNGELTLRFASVSGPVERYRIWVGEGADARPATPFMDVAAQAGSSQQAVVSGLAIDTDYTVAVSAIGQQDGRVTVSPISDSIHAKLLTPQPAQLAMSLDAGATPAAQRAYQALDGSEETLLITAAAQATLNISSDQKAALTLTIDGTSFDSVEVPAGGTHSFVLNDLLETGTLAERTYYARIEAVNDRGDRSTAYGVLSIDRTAPLLIATGGEDETGAPIPLNGTVDSAGRVLIEGQTEIGAKLDIAGVAVPLDDAGRFVYYAPLAWDSSTDRIMLAIRASDDAGNTTEHRFEVLKDVDGSGTDDASELAALTTGRASMTEPYRFGKTDYRAIAVSDRVRVYAVPMAAASVVTIDGHPLPTEGYVEVDVSEGGRTVQLSVQPAGGGTAKEYTLEIDTGSSVALLNALTLQSQTGDTLMAQPFTGTEAGYDVYADHSVESVTLTPGALMAGSTIKVKEQAVQSGQVSMPIPLQAGENRIPVSVVSPDGSETRAYQISVWREASSDADLQQLGLSTAEAVLLPGFDPNVTQYRVLAPNAAATFELLPVARQADAVIRVNDQAVSGSPVVLPFGGDSLPVDIEVRAQDDSVKSYSLTVVRQKATPAQPPLLTSLEAGTVLDTDFSAYKFSYGTKSKTESSSVAITAQADDPLATVTVMGVSRQGGGKFSPPLAVGANTVIVQVESADRTASLTYSIDVTRISESSSEQPNVRQSTITGSSGGWADQIPIVRSVTPSGSKVDTVKLEAAKAKEIVARVERNGDKVAQIHVTDLPDDPAEERMVSLSAESLSLLADGDISLQIVLPDAVIDLPAASLRQLGNEGNDAYFRIIPIIALDEQGEVKSRVTTAELVQQAAGRHSVSVIGHPVKIETNATGFKAKVLFPLTGLMLPSDEAAAARMLAGLAVYIEHSDGDKALARGEIRYDETGHPIGIEVVIDKFSTFTIVRFDDGDPSEVLEPYLSGYPDGTFRPSQSLKRSELASILHRLGLDGSAADREAAKPQTTGYPDLKAGYWAAEAIYSLQRSGLMLGDDQGRFRPEAAITRAELASILSRLLPAAAAADDAQSSRLVDAEGHWAAQAIGKAVQAGLLAGYPDGTFRPDNQLTRAEAVRVLNRLLDRPVAGAAYSVWPDVPAGHWAIREIESASGTVTVSPEGRVQVAPRR